MFGSLKISASGIFLDSCHGVLRVVRDSERMSSGMALLVTACRCFAVEIAWLLTFPHRSLQTTLCDLEAKEKENQHTEIATVQVARIQVARIQVASNNSRASSRCHNTWSSEDARYCRWRCARNVFSCCRRARHCERWVKDLEEQPGETLHCQNRSNAPEMILRIAEHRRLSPIRHVVLWLVG